MVREWVPNAGSVGEEVGALRHEQEGDWGGLVSVMMYRWYDMNEGVMKMKEVKKVRERLSYK